MKKILVVDDENDIRALLKDILNVSGFEVMEAENGQIALEKYYQYKPDAAIIDLNMPIMDGVKLTQYIHEENRDFPILILSGYLHKYSVEDLKKLKKIYLQIVL
ncbi:MAG TPA: response regulator [Calditrichaeota bacterium]|nr:response regulator [Calditrichota bacterium]